MPFTDAIKTVLSKYATISGRATRPEFWWWILFVVLLNMVTNIVDGALIAPSLGFVPFENMAGQPLSLLVAVVLFLPGLCVFIRRLHDVDRSGWWLLITLIPLIGALVLLYWAVQPGTEGSNRFGASVS